MAFTAVDEEELAVVSVAIEYGSPFVLLGIDSRSAGDGGGNVTVGESWLDDADCAFEAEVTGAALLIEAAADAPGDAIGACACFRCFTCGGALRALWAFLALSA